MQRRVPVLSGFTLVELIIVIVILGILSAVAVLRFSNQTSNAKNAAVTSIAAALSAASADNFARRTMGDTINTNAISNCNAISALLPTSALVVNRVSATIVSQTLTAGVGANCTLQLSGATASTFRGLGVS